MTTQQYFVGPLELWLLYLVYDSGCLLPLTEEKLIAVKFVLAGLARTLCGDYFGSARIDGGERWLCRVEVPKVGENGDTLFAHDLCQTFCND